MCEEKPLRKIYTLCKLLAARIRRRDAVHVADFPKNITQQMDPLEMASVNEIQADEPSASQIDSISKFLDLQELERRKMMVDLITYFEKNSKDPEKCAFSLTKHPWLLRLCIGGIIFRASRVQDNRGKHDSKPGIENLIVAIFELIFKKDAKVDAIEPMADVLDSFSDGLHLFLVRCMALPSHQHIESKDETQSVHHLQACSQILHFYRETLHHILESSRYTKSHSLLFEIAQGLLRDSYQCELLCGTSKWRDNFNAYMKWEPISSEKDAVNTALLENAIFQESLKRRAAYEKRCRSDSFSSRDWIEYIMWEYGNVKCLENEFAQRKLSPKLSQVLKILPFFLCERALNRASQHNIALLFLSHQVRKDLQQLSDSTFSTCFNNAWSQSVQTHPNLFRPSLKKSIKRAFTHSKNGILECHFSTDASILIQYIALLRLTVKGCDHFAHSEGPLSFAAYAFNIIPCLVTYALQAHFSSNRIWSEVVMLVYHLIQRVDINPIQGQCTSPEEHENILMLLGKMKVDRFRHALSPGLELHREFLLPGVHSDCEALSLLSSGISVRETMPCCTVDALSLLMLSLISGSTSANDCMSQITSRCFESISSLIKYSSNRQGAGPISYAMVKDEIEYTLKILFVTVHHFANEGNGKESVVQKHSSTARVILSEWRSMMRTFDLAYYGHDNASLSTLQECLYSIDSVQLSKIQKRHQKDFAKSFESLRSSLYAPKSDNEHVMNMKALESAILKRLYAEILVLVQSLVVPSSASTEIQICSSRIIPSIVNRWIELSDEMRVYMQRKDFHAWTSSFSPTCASYDSNISPLGTIYVYICNLPTGLGTNHIQAWMSPIFSALNLQIVHQKKQTLVLVHMDSPESAHKFAIARNRSEWKEGDKIRKVRVQHIESHENLKIIQQQFDTKKSHGIDRKRFIRSEALDRTKVQKSAPRENTFFSNMFSKFS